MRWVGQLLLETSLLLYRAWLKLQLLRAWFKLSSNLYFNTDSKLTKCNATAISYVQTTTKFRNSTQRYIQLPFAVKKTKRSDTPLPRHKIYLGFTLPSHLHGRFDRYKSLRSIVRWATLLTINILFTKVARWNMQLLRIFLYHEVKMNLYNFALECHPRVQLLSRLTVHVHAWLYL